MSYLKPRNTTGYGPSTLSLRQLKFHTKKKKREVLEKLVGADKGHDGRRRERRRG